MRTSESLSFTRTPRRARPVLLAPTKSTPAWAGVSGRFPGADLLALPANLRHPVLNPDEAAGLSAALDEIPSSAFVIWADGSVALANVAGQSASDRDPELVASSLLASLGGRDGTFRVRRILSPGAPSHYIAVQQGEAEDPAPRVAAAAVRWGVTPRQAEVLGLLALGQANKTIAQALGCAGATVEIHVSTLLKKSGCESRCELVSKFWSGPIGPRQQERSAGERP